MLPPHLWSNCFLSCKKAFHFSMESSVTPCLRIWALRPMPREFMRSGELLRPLMRALRPAPRVTFLRKESHQRFARNLLVLDFEEVLTSGEGGLAPFDPPPPALAVLVAIA